MSCIPSRRTQSTLLGSVGLRTYRLLWICAAPALPRLARSLHRDPIAAPRRQERFGISERPQPDRRPIWLHGSSIGETRTLLRLAKAMREHLPNLACVLTFQTLGAQRVLEGQTRGMEWLQVAYAPFDHPRYVRRFLDHWRPAAVFTSEAELWPMMLTEAKRRDLPTGLLQGRLSQKHHRFLGNLGAMSRVVFDDVDLLLVTSATNSERLTSLAGRPALDLGDLKLACGAFPLDEALYQAWSRETGGRFVLAAANLHPPDDDIAIRLHQKLQEVLGPGGPTPLTLLIPRHIERADAMEAGLRAHGLSFVRHSQVGSGGDRNDGSIRSPFPHIPPDVSMYLADCVGFVGLFYAVADLCFLGGSFSDRGGHNPMEPAYFGLPQLYGPDMRVPARAAALLEAAGASISCAKADVLITKAAELALDDAKRAKMSQAARKVTQDQERLPDHIAKHVIDFLQQSGFDLSFGTDST